MIRLCCDSFQRYVAPAAFKRKGGASKSQEGPESPESNICVEKRRLDDRFIVKHPRKRSAIGRGAMQFKFLSGYSVLQL